MALPPNYLVATVRYGVPERPLQLNVLWFLFDSGSLPSDLQGLAFSLADQLNTNINDPLSVLTTSETDLIGIHVSMHINGVIYDSVVPFTSLTGDEPADTLPEYCAAVVQKRTAVAGRSGRGRWFVGCVPETAADNSSLVPTYIADMETLAAAFITTLNVGGGVWKAALHSQSLDTLQPIVSTHVVDHLGTQRRRRVRPLL